MSNYRNTATATSDCWKVVYTYGKGFTVSARRQDDDSRWTKHAWFKDRYDLTVWAEVHGSGAHTATTKVLAKASEVIAHNRQAYLQEYGQAAS